MGEVHGRPWLVPHCDGFIMSPLDDMVPARRRGRPMRAYSLADLVQPARSSAGATPCRACPKCSRAWCPIRAARIDPAGPACAYGRALILAARRRSRGDV